MSYILCGRELLLLQERKWDMAANENPEMESAIVPKVYLSSENADQVLSYGYCGLGLDHEKDTFFQPWTVELR